MGKIIILGTAHGMNVYGKQSPDGRLKEYKYSREIVNRLKAELEAEGYTVKVDMPEDTVPQPQTAELNRRCAIVNSYCLENGISNCIYVSIHVNAAGSERKWLDAGGWCAYTSRGKTRADALATCLYEAAEKHLQEYAEIMEGGKEVGLYSKKQRPFRTDYTDGDPDQEANFYVLAHTMCPAVLTENLFMDNTLDVQYLESEKGKQAIVALHKEGIINYINNQK